MGWLALVTVILQVIDQLLIFLNNRKLTPRQQKLFNRARAKCREFDRACVGAGCSEEIPDDV